MRRNVFAQDGHDKFSECGPLLRPPAVLGDVVLLPSRARCAEPRGALASWRQDQLQSHHQPVSLPAQWLQRCARPSLPLPSLWRPPFVGENCQTVITLNGGCPLYCPPHTLLHSRPALHPRPQAAQHVHYPLPHCTQPSASALRGPTNAAEAPHRSRSSRTTRYRAWPPRPRRCRRGQSSQSDSSNLAACVHGSSGRPDREGRGRRVAPSSEH